MTPPTPAGRASGHFGPEAGNGHSVGELRSASSRAPYNSYDSRLLAVASETDSHLRQGAAGQGDTKTVPATIDVILLTLDAGPAGYSELGAALPPQRQPYLYDTMNTLVHGLEWAERASPAAQAIQTFRLTPEGQLQADKLLGRPVSCATEATPTQAWAQYRDVMASMAGVLAAFFGAPLVGGPRVQPERPQLRQPPSASGPV